MTPRPTKHTQVEIKPCRKEDLVALERSMPSTGRSRFHERRFRQQLSGASTYLVAWLDGEPVGHLNVIWTEDEDLSKHLSGCPELNALGVWPPERRSQGIGRALVAAGEQMVRARGLTRAAMGVGLANHRAASLYEELGYRDWGHGSYVDRWTWVDDDGVEHEDSEPCTWLIKDIDGRTDETPQPGSAQVLRGGHVSHVLRDGQVVLRDCRPWSATVQSLLTHLRSKGFTAAPEPLGFDGEGQEMLSFIDGEAGSGRAPSYVWNDEVLTEIATLLRGLHDASATFSPPADAVWQVLDPRPAGHEVICHGDIAPWNTIFRGGRPIAFIDWEWAGPGFRVEDIAYALWHFIPLCDDARCVEIGAPSDRGTRARRVRLFCEAYGWPLGPELFDAVVARQTSTLEGIQRLAADGVEAYRILLANGAGEGITREREWVRANIEVFLAR